VQQVQRIDSVGLIPVRLPPPVNTILKVNYLSILEFNYSTWCVKLNKMVNINTDLVKFKISWIICHYQKVAEKQLLMPHSNKEPWLTRGDPYWKLCYTLLKSLLTKCQSSPCEMKETRFGKLFTMKKTSSGQVCTTLPNWFWKIEHFVGELDQTQNRMADLWKIH
jgi:hypothetical protein